MRTWHKILNQIARAKTEKRFNHETCVFDSRGGGSTDLERGYGDVRPLRPPFHASPAARKGPISSKRVSSQGPLLRKFWNLVSTASIFTQILAHKPQIWKFSAHKPPNLDIFCSQAPLFRGKCQFASPTLRKSGLHTPTWKKVECPPGIWFTTYVIWSSKMRLVNIDSET